MEGMRRLSVSAALPWIALVSVWFLWGSTFLGIRVAVETIPPFLMPGLRYLLAGGILTAAIGLWKRDAWRELHAPQWRSLLMTSFLLLVVGNGLLCYAEVQLRAGVSALLVATTPIWMVIVSGLAARTRIAAWAGVGLVIGTLGVVALAGIPGAGTPLAPTVLVLIGSAAWAIGSVYARRHAELRRNPLIPALEMLAGGAMLSVVALLLGERLEWNHVSTLSLEGFAWLVGPGAIVGYTAYGYAVRKLPTTVVATYAYVNPIVAVALGAWLLREPITVNILVGGAAIVLAIVAILKAAPVEPTKRSESRAGTADAEIAKAS